jgi:transcription elongation factor GreA
MIESRILQLEERLRAATVIEPSELDTDLVRVGTTVSVEDADGAKHVYHIVGSAEAKPAEAKLSNESPVGKALMGKKKGEVATVSTPKGERKLTIKKIEVA